MVYKYSCSGCQACYLGKTSRHLSIRGREHLGTGKKGQPIKTSPSAISEHIKQTDHCANLENFTILEKASNKYNLLIFESFFILHNRPSLNAQNSSIFCYRTLLQNSIHQCSFVLIPGVFSSFTYFLFPSSLD